MGGGLGFGAEQLAENLDPQTAKSIKRYVTNAAGQYSLPVSLGFGIGQAIREGSKWQTGLTKEAAFAVPLPTSTPITAWTKFLTGDGPPPPGSYPKLFKELNEAIGEIGVGGNQLRPQGGASSIQQSKYKLIE